MLKRYLLWSKAVVVCTTGWGQGRAVFGGMAAALAMAHLLPVIPQNMPLRSVSVSFVAPLNAGPATQWQAGRHQPANRDRIRLGGTYA